jgi:gluconate 2-dehydrogenase
MPVIYHNRRPIAAEAAAALSPPPEWRSLDDLLRESDFVLLQAPLTAETRGMVGARQIALMKPGAILVNTGRGGLVDEDALADALTRGAIAGAALDVFEGEPNVNPRLLACPNLVLAPHIGTATRASRHAMLMLAIANLKGMLAGEG